MLTFDHIILGTGQATGTLLGKLIPTGERIAVIEGAQIGGSCVNYGCTPTKTMVASARAIHFARRGAEFGFEAQPTLNFSRVMERMNGIRTGDSKGLESWMQSADNLSLFKGYGQFVSNKVISVNGEQLEGSKIYINVGTKAFVPPLNGLDGVPYLDSAGLLELTELPRHLLIVGGGYIGVEFAQVFRRLGSQVSILQRGDQLMPREDKDIAQSVQAVLEKEGVQIYCNTTIERVQHNEGIEVQFSMEGNSEVVKGDQLLMAVGRRPNTANLGLEHTSIQLNERGYIEVDDYCQTAVEGVFALGDVNGKGAFTHTSVNDAEIALDRLYGGTRRLSDRIMVYALFSDPPLGRVGLSEKEALAKGYKVLKATRSMSKISRAKEMGETDGFAKLLVDAETDKIIGAAIHGPGGDEIINMFAAIMHSDIPCIEYRKVVLVHPTVSELMPWVLDGLEPIN